MEYFIHLAILFAIYSILGISLNLVVGYTGLLSVTQSAFYGIGAYATAILSVDYGINFFVSIILGVLIAGFVSFLVGIVLSKFEGDYFALVSFGFNIIAFSIFLNWQSLTRGPLGIPGILRPELFGFNLSNNLSFLILAIIFLIIIYLISRFIVNSSFGRVLKAIREDEKAIQVFGYRTSFYKAIIFIVGAMMAAVAGSLFASYITFIDPSTFTLNESIFILSIIILGGLATLKGSILGALYYDIASGNFEICRFSD